MKVMFRILRFLTSYLVSGVLVYLSGYGNLMDDVMPDVAARTFFQSTFVVAVIVMLMWEMYLAFKQQIYDLTKRIEELEENK